MLLLRPEAFGGAILLRPMIPFTPASMPNLTGKQVLLLPGQFDEIAHPTHAITFGASLRDSGADIHVTQIQASHGLVEGDVIAATAWFDRLRNSESIPK